MILHILLQLIQVVLVSVWGTEPHLIGQCLHCLGRWRLSLRVEHITAGVLLVNSGLLWNQLLGSCCSLLDIVVALLISLQPQLLLELLCSRGLSIGPTHDIVLLLLVLVIIGLLSGGIWLIAVSVTIILHFV